MKAVRRKVKEKGGKIKVVRRKEEVEGKVERRKQAG